MPEGPEIRRAADRIAAAIQGRVVRQAWFAFERLKPWEARLAGRRVRAVSPRGKALLVRFSGQLNLYSHNQLYGRWYVSSSGAAPRTGRQLRVLLRVRDACARLYSASDVEVLRDAELRRHPYLARLGPDLLDGSVTLRAVQQRLEDERFARRALGSLLLDQGFLSGVGNYLRSEILFAAGLDPARRPVDLDAGERQRLARAALSLSRRAYRTGGITSSPTIVKRLRAQRLPRREYRHFVFGRTDQPCHRCGGTVIREQASGRRLYRCPACQA